MLIFDIETGPLPDDQLRKLYTPPELPEHPGEFDESTVKVPRNWTDPVKIKAKIEQSRADHQKLVDGHDGLCKQVAEQAWSDLKGNAALDATTGQVIAIGYYSPDKDKVAIDHSDGMLERFWAKAENCRESHRRVVGLNIFDFDLPFLIRRSWICGVDVPSWVIRQDRFFDDVFVDLRKVWLCGQWGAGTKSSFDHLARAFSTGGKPDEVDGSMFAELWETDRAKAIEYLANDVRQPAEWARRMGVL